MSKAKIAARLYPNPKKIDTVKKLELFERNDDVFRDAANAYAGLDDFRTQARRNEMYTFGDQWGDLVRVNGKMITEAQNILNQGSVPLKNNRIRSAVRSVLGVFSSAQTEPVCVSRDRDEQGKGEMMSATLQYVYQTNQLWELDRRNLEYFLITGTAFFKSTAGWRDMKQQDDVWTDLVNYNRVFFDNHMQDPRHWDCHLIGELHDLGLYDVMAQFSDGSKEKAEDIRRLYNKPSDRTISYLRNLTDNNEKNRCFSIPDDETRCRVIEVWRKESKERLIVHDRLEGTVYKVEIDEELLLISENETRKQEQGEQGIAEEDFKLLEYSWTVDNFWQYYYMTPTGEVLKQGETPYWHGSHPYSFKIYPFYNGRVYPFVGDFIDQQRYINRLITMQDFMMKNAAKGVLMFPEESKPDDMSMEDIAEEWATSGGMIYYKAKAGITPPHQVVTNTSQMGVYDMLNVQLKMFEDVSGVQGALQGRAPAAGTPASLFMQQTQNATTALTDLFESYREVRQERDIKNMKLVQQNYTDMKYINIIGGDAKQVTYNPEMVRNAEMDLSIVESTSTPAYRMIMNDMLVNLEDKGKITLDNMLEMGAFPFADKLRQIVAGNQQAAAQGQPGQPMPQDIQQQITAGMQRQ